MVPGVSRERAEQAFVGKSCEATSPAQSDHKTLQSDVIVREVRSHAVDFCAGDPLCFLLPQLARPSNDQDDGNQQTR